MSTWTCDGKTAWRLPGLAFALTLVLILSACLPPEAGEKTADRRALIRTSFFAGGVKVVGPQGYCIDPGSVRRSPAGGFALIASCARLTGQSARDPHASVMTVSILPAQPGIKPPDTVALTRALAPTRVLSAHEGEGLSLVQVSRGGDKILPGSDPVYWRASMVINNHLIGLALYSPQGAPTSISARRNLLIALAKELRATNGPP